METGLSVDDRPNELNIAFWVISSVGATRPLLLHIIYVSVHATSLSFSLSFTPHTPLHTHPHSHTSVSLCIMLLFHPFISFSFLQVSSVFPCLFSSFLPSLSLSLPLTPSPLYLCLLLHCSLPPSAALTSYSV